MDEIIKQCIEISVNEFNKENNKDLLEEKILDPIIKYIGSRIWPYILYVTIVLFSIICILIYMIVKTNSIRVSI